MENGTNNEKIYFFPYGLPGFETLHYFRKIDLEDDTLAQLISVEDEEIGFIIMRPGHIFSDYLSQIDLDDDVVEALKITHGLNPDIWVILKLNHRDVAQSTVNLRAPIILNNQDKLGAQVILSDDRYSSREPLSTTPPQNAQEGAGV